MMKNLLSIACYLLTLGSSVALPITSAQIGEQSSDKLIVEFDNAVTVSDAKGFRLVGGVAHIDKLISGSGTRQLVFQLTDFVLPDDQFSLLYWKDIGDALIAGNKLPDVTKTVTSNATRYNGNGTLYYVSTSGNDRNDGRSPNSPFSTFNRAHGAVQPGDFILLKRGDTWDRTNVVVTKSGTANNYLTIGAYGSGKQPIIYSRGLSLNYKGYKVTGATFAVHGADFVQVDNIHIKTDNSIGGGGSDDGIQLLDCKYAIVSNCTAEAPEPGGYFGIRVNTWVYGKDNEESAIYNNTYPQVLNCEVFGYLGNMGTQIWPYDGRHTIEKGGIIENCISRDPVLPKNGGNVWENIMINRGDFHGFVIRKNKVYGFRSNGLEAFGSKNVIIEYNEVYNPANYDRGGRAIKAGGYNSASQTAPGVGPLYSENIIVRYNKVYNITQGNTQGVNAIDGSLTRSGKIYGNLVYNVKGIGIKITGELNSTGWDVYNNTVLNCGEDALQLYTSGPYAANVRIKNNILQGKLNDINCIVNGTSEKASGQNNLLLTGKTGGSYAGTGDMKYSNDDLFVSQSNRDYQLMSSSFARRKGVAIADYKRGLNGNSVVNPPDLGAYQFANNQSAPAPSPAPAPTPEPAPAPAPTPPQSPDGPAGAVTYKYYVGEWSQLPDFNNLKLRKSGTVENFTLSPREVDNRFAFVFESYIKIEEAGKYTFYTTSDDGSKLYIDGKQIVDNDGLHAARERLGTVYLTQGYHPIRVTFFDRTYADELQVRYAGPGISKQTIPNNVLFREAPADTPTPAPTADQQQGLRYSYYHGDWQQLPDFRAMKAVKTGVVSNFTLQPRTQQDRFGFLYEGYLEVKQAGKYTFYTTSDDGSKLYIDGKQIVDNDGLHAARERLGTVYLTQGYHPIRVTFFERLHNNMLQVHYAGPGISKQTIPNNVLFREAPADTPTPAPTADQQQGLRYSYYHGDWQQLPDFRAMKAVKTGVVSNFTLQPRTQQDRFGFLYEGYLEVKQAGKYTFYTTSDDGSKLYIDGKQIVDNDGLHAARERLGTVYLTQGYHPIRVTFFDRTYADELQVRYAGPGISKQTIPSNVLSYELPENARLLVGLPSSSEKQIAGSIASFEENHQGDAIRVFPNPVKEIINVVTASEDKSLPVKLFNQHGALVYEHTVHPKAGDARIDLTTIGESLKSGIYVLKIYSQHLGIRSFRLLKE